MLDEIRTGNWEEAFKYARTPEPALPGMDLDCSGFDREDVKEVLAHAEGENDGPNWIAVFLLKDHRFACLRAWCDFTGWG